MKRAVKRVIHSGKGLLRIFGKLHEKATEEDCRGICMEKEKYTAKQEQAIKEVMAKTGWTREDSVRRMEEARKRCGILYPEYAENDFHKVETDEQGPAFRAILEKKAAKQRKQDKENCTYVAKIMGETGWSYEYAEERILEARARTHCTYKEFYGYRFWELDEKTQGQLYLTVDAKKIMKKFETDEEIIAIMRDKKRTNEMFSEYLKRDWCMNDEISEDDFVRRFSGSKKVIYKPIKGMQGTGITVFPIDEQNAAEVYGQLSKLPSGVVEEYVVQHPLMSSLNPSSVNTMRIVTVSSQTEPVTPDGKHTDVAYVCLRIGGGEAFVDNYHSGGMATAVDLETGCIVTDGVNEQGKIIAAHPKTGVTFRGFQVPYFKEALAMVTEACEKNGLNAYIGWDVAIREDGPVLIEVNQRPGSMLLTAPWISEKRGMKHVMEKYL